MTSKNKTDINTLIAFVVIFLFLSFAIFKGCDSFNNYVNKKYYIQECK